MKILVDMNLSPVWVEFLTGNGFEAARGPSVIQVRTQNPLPEAIGEIVLVILRTQSDQLSR